MIGAVSQAFLAMAASCLGDGRREWALAMQAEYEAAKEDGKPLTFALGCLCAAWRELPTHEEGRFIIASNALALVLIIPVAALLFASIVADFPFSYFDLVGAPGRAEGVGEHAPLLSDANRFALPPLAAVVLLLACAHLRIAWLVLERDWQRVAAVGMRIAAASVTLIIFTTLVFDHGASAFAQAAMLALELSAISALARWHARSFGGAPETLI